MSYFAEINEQGQVQRVIVADTIEWCQSHLGGTWVETQMDSVEQYAGIGFYHDASSQWKFATAWMQPINAETAYAVGSYCYHGGKIWQSKLPANVWEPGVLGWRDPISQVPQWIQPVGSVDAYINNAVVFHNGKEWRSNIPANVWEPGGQGITQWDDITESAPSDATNWISGESVSVGEERIYNGSVYSVIQSHTTQMGWEPPNVPALWKFERDV